MCYFETELFGFARKEKRVDDEFSESLESFGVAADSFFGSPFVVCGGADVTGAMTFHLGVKQRELYRLTAGDVVYMRVS